MFEHLIESNCAFVEMLCQILLVKANMREIQPAISADYCQFDVALLQRLSDAPGNEALSRCIDPADSDKQGVLRRKRFSLLDNRRNHRTIFEHELQRLRVFCRTNRRFKFQKRSQLFIGTNDEALSVVAV